MLEKDMFYILNAIAWSFPFSWGRCHSTKLINLPYVFDCVYDQ